MLKSNSSETSETATVSADADSASKLGEFYNQSLQAKQNFLAKFPPIKQTSGFGAEATVTKTEDKVTIETTKKDDKIGITQDAKTGDMTVEVNGKNKLLRARTKTIS